MLVLIGKSKLLLARLTSQVRRASEVGWLSDSLFVLSWHFFCIWIIQQKVTSHPVK